MSKMTRAAYQNELKKLIDEFIAADQMKEIAAAQVREAEGDKASAAARIRCLSPRFSEELIKALDTPPSLCEDCAAPTMWGGTCSACTLKRKEKEETARIEARARELATKLGATP